MSEHSLDILIQNLESLGKSVFWLKRSLTKAQEIDLKQPELTEDQFDTMENLTSRYARTVDMIIGRVFRSIDAVELEDSGTLIDVVNRAEKRGIIISALKIRELKDLRNEIVHEYETEDLQKTFARTMQFLPEVLQIADNTWAYCRKRGYIKS
jgi:uncharacterized protein YutE (UPF0331/DUF86 family)